MKGSAMPRIPAPPDSHHAPPDRHHDSGVTTYRLAPPDVVERVRTIVTAPPDVVEPPPAGPSGRTSYRRRWSL